MTSEEIKRAIEQAKNVQWEWSEIGKQFAKALLLRDQQLSAALEALVDIRNNTIIWHKDPIENAKILAAIQHRSHSGLEKIKGMETK